MKRLLTQIFLISIFTLISNLLIAQTYVVTSNNRSGESFIAAIEAVNAGTHNRIEFNLPFNNTVIDLEEGAAPILRKQCYIDGLSQDGASVGNPLVVIRNGAWEGVQIGTGANGTSINGLIISDNGKTSSGDGIMILECDSITIENCFIGVNQTGNSSYGNTSNGIYAENSTNIIIRNNVIGGAIENTANGICLGKNSSATITGNYIGLGIDGVSDVGNGLNGILIQDSSSTIIGGANPEDRNYIAGNGNNGIHFIDASDVKGANQILRNYFGVSEDGNSRVENGDNAITNEGTKHILIDNNIISGSGQSGLSIRNDADSCIISNNIIGLNVNGDAVLENKDNGIHITGATYTKVSNNVISGNCNNGIIILSKTHEPINPGGHYTKIIDNIIGLGSDGISIINNPCADPNHWSGGPDQGNGQSGIYIENSKYLSIEGNIISGNTYWGLFLNQGCDSSKIDNNFVGTDITGIIAKGNNWDGIFVYDSPNTDIINNLSSGNITGRGINLEANVTGLTNIKGNKVGVDASGINALGNGTSGILIRDVNSTTFIEDNIIADNKHSGVEIKASQQIEIYDNLIGVNVNGDAMGNSREGISVYDNSQYITIGEIEKGNVISNSTNEDIYLRDNWVSSGRGQGVNVNNARYVKIRGNSISCNAYKGIDLNNGNNNIYPPIIDINSSKDSIYGTVASGVIIDIYEADSCYSSDDSEGRQQGAVYLTTIEVMDGKWSFKPSSISKNFVFTVTDDNGNTSEFSNVATNKFIPIVVFIDENENETLDNGEVLLNNQKMKIIEDDLYASTGNHGYIYINHNNGIFNIEFLNTENLGFTTDSIFSLEISNSTIEDTLFYGVIILKEENIISTSLTGSRTRAGFEATYWIDYNNEGVLSHDGTIDLIFDENSSFVTSVPTPDTQYNNKITWNYSSLEAFEQRQIKVTLQMPGVDKLGDTLISYCKITSSGNDIDESNNADTLKQILTGSYDPNDKLVNKGLGEENYTLFNEEIEYTIRFQNTGTDTAFNVYLIDTISDYLDIQSFELVGSSHDVYYEISKSNIVTFYFDDIMLPDSNVNEPASNGYVRYSINPLSDLSENTEVNNTAYIYFDFNPAIVTNTITNTYVSVYPSLTSIKDSYELTNNIEVYPNPFKDELKINSGEVLQSISLLDLTGKCVIKEDNIGKTKLTLTTSNIQQGVYFISLMDIDGKVYNSKLVKF